MLLSPAGCPWIDPVRGSWELQEVEFPVGGPVKVRVLDGTGSLEAWITGSRLRVRGLEGDLWSAPLRSHIQVLHVGDRCIYLSEESLHVVDGQGETSLPVAGRVSVCPQGKHAVVLQGGSLTLVNLSTRALRAEVHLLEPGDWVEERAQWSRDNLLAIHLTPSTQLLDDPVLAHHQAAEDFITGLPTPDHVPRSTDFVSRLCVPPYGMKPVSVFRVSEDLQLTPLHFLALPERSRVLHLSEHTLVYSYTMDPRNHIVCIRARQLDGPSEATLVTEVGVRKYLACVDEAGQWLCVVHRDKATILSLNNPRERQTLTHPRLRDCKNLLWSQPRQAFFAVPELADNLRILIAFTGA